MRSHWTACSNDADGDYDDDVIPGHSEEELPESRRGFSGANFVDDFPWIWRRFHGAGFVTQWIEDGCGVGTFQYRLMGFRVPRID